MLLQSEEPVRTSTCLAGLTMNTHQRPTVCLGRGPNICHLIWACHHPSPWAWLPLGSPTTLPSAQEVEQSRAEWSMCQPHSCPNRTGGTTHGHVFRSLHPPATVLCWRLRGVVWRLAKAYSRWWWCVCPGHPPLANTARHMAAVGSWLVGVSDKRVAGDWLMVLSLKFGYIDVTHRSTGQS